MSSDSLSFKSPSGLYKIFSYSDNGYLASEYILILNNLSKIVRLVNNYVYKQGVSWQGNKKISENVVREIFSDSIFIVEGEISKYIYVYIDKNECEKIIDNNKQHIKTINYNDGFIDFIGLNINKYNNSSNDIYFNLVIRIKGSDKEYLTMPEKLSNIAIYQ